MQRTLALKPMGRCVTLLAASFDVYLSTLITTLFYLPPPTRFAHRPWSESLLPSSYSLDPF